MSAFAWHPGAGARRTASEGQRRAIRDRPAQTRTAVPGPCPLGLSPTPAAAQWRLPTTCSVVNQNLFVRDVMADLYYWYTEIPQERERRGLSVA